MSKKSLTMDEISHGLFELEGPCLQAGNLAFALMMMSTSDILGGDEESNALNTIAGMLVVHLRAIEKARVELWEGVHDTKRERPAKGAKLHLVAHGEEGGAA
jgi:hypothetical protein